MAPKEYSSHCEHNNSKYRPYLFCFDFHNTHPLLHLEKFLTILLYRPAEKKQGGRRIIVLLYKLLRKQKLKPRLGTSFCAFRSGVQSLVLYIMRQSLAHQSTFPIEMINPNTLPTWIMSFGSSLFGRSVIIKSKNL